MRKLFFMLITLALMSNLKSQNKKNFASDSTLSYHHAYGKRIIYEMGIHSISKSKFDSLLMINLTTAHLLIKARKHEKVATWFLFPGIIGVIFLPPPVNAIFFFLGMPGFLIENIAYKYNYNKGIRLFNVLHNHLHA